MQLYLWKTDEHTCHPERVATIAVAPRAKILDCDQPALEGFLAEMTDRPNLGLRVEQADRAEELSIPPGDPNYEVALAQTIERESNFVVTFDPEIYGTDLR